MNTVYCKLPSVYFDFGSAHLSAGQACLAVRQAQSPKGL